MSFAPLCRRRLSDEGAQARLSRKERQDRWRQQVRDMAQRKHRFSTYWCFISPNRWMSGAFALSACFQSASTVKPTL